MSMSLDGYIEDVAGGIAFSEPDEEVHRFANQQTRETAAFLFGRGLYEVMEEFWTAPERADGGEVEAAIGRLQEEVCHATALFLAEKDPLARRSEREDPVEPRLDEEFDQGSEPVLVEGAAVLHERRNRCGESPFQHDVTLSSAVMSALKVERDGDVLRVTLAKPERRNAFDAALIAELTAAFADVGDARVVVLAGEGPSFCAGADVEWQRSSIDLSYDENVEDAMRLYRMLEAIDSCPAPVVCVVHGYALGGGSGLVACADIAVAWPDAVFGFSEVRLGIIPAVISPFVLPRIGAAARRYFVTGEHFDAEVAPGSGSSAK
jgi:hypothetical protein